MLKTTVLALVVLQAASQGSQIQRQHGVMAAPREPFARLQAPPRPLAPGFEHRLNAKFHDHVLARLDDGGRLVSLGGADLAPLLLALDGLGDAPVRFRPLIDLPPAELARIQGDAAARSGRMQPDLGGMFIVEAAADGLLRLADVLHASDLVEVVHFEMLGAPPPGWFGSANGGGDGCVDIAPLTQGYFDRQGYHGADIGLGMDAAWAYPGGRGQGVRVADAEYGYRDGHEDLCDITPEPGQVVHPTVISNGWHEHGTAVLGELVGGDNGYGVVGLVPDAQASFFFEWTTTGRRRVAAITAAIASVDAGDVVLLEMQMFGPGGNYAPAEIDPMVWMVTRLGVDRGVTVVAAAGNGTQELESPGFAEYRGRVDSGAIIVGAGSMTGTRVKLGFSTYGSRVNVHGWGHNVFTAGYGDFIRVGGDADQGYTASFSGTSSASPFVASAVVSLQGIHMVATDEPLAPEAVRQLLIDTGKAQGAGGHIGPLPDMAAAVDRLIGLLCPVDMDGDGELTVFDFLAFQTAFDAGEGVADFDRDGRLTIFDFLAFQSGFEAGCE